MADGAVGKLEIMPRGVCNDTAFSLFTALYCSNHTATCFGRSRRPSLGFMFQKYIKKEILCYIFLKREA